MPLPLTVVLRPVCAGRPVSCESGGERCTSPEGQEKALAVEVDFKFGRACRESREPSESEADDVRKYSTASGGWVRASDSSTPGEHGRKRDSTSVGLPSPRVIRALIAIFWCAR